MPTAGPRSPSSSRRSSVARIGRPAGTSPSTISAVRVRRQYTVKGKPWKTAWTTLPQKEIARVVWATRTIELDHSFRKQTPGWQEFILRHELLHVLLRSSAHVHEKISHARLVELGMALDNLVHFGSDTFKAGT